MSPLLSIAEVWQEFETLLLGGAPEHVKTDMRRAFYAGYQSAINASTELGEDYVSEEAGVEFLQARLAELEAFGESIKAGKA